METLRGIKSKLLDDFDDFQNFFARRLKVADKEAIISINVRNNETSANKRNLAIKRHLRFLRRCTKRGFIFAAPVPCRRLRFFDFQYSEIERACIKRLRKFNSVSVIFPYISTSRRLISH